VQRVRHEHAVHAAEAERPGEIGDPLVEPDRIEAGMDGLRLRRERPAVEVDGVNGTARPEKVRKCEGERAGPRSELEPDTMWIDRIADQPYMVGVIQGAISLRVRLRA
jgi:hypothetical protein